MVLPTGHKFPKRKLAVKLYAGYLSQRKGNPAQSGRNGVLEGVLEAVLLGTKRLSSLKLRILKRKNLKKSAWPASVGHERE
jgi:hypothetical protein